MRTSFLAALFAVALAVQSASGVIVVQYDTASSTSNPTIAASAADSSVTADSMAAGSGITANSGSTWNWRGWGDGTNPYLSFTDAVTNGDIWTWGFDVTSALTNIDLTTMDIRLDRSGTGPNEVRIDASVNGGGAITVLTHSFGDSDAAVDFVGVDLTGIGTLTTGDSIVFTLGAFGADTGGASDNGTFDLETVDFGGSDPRSLRIEGTVTAVPEASAFLFGGLAVVVAGLGYSRRRCS